MYLYLGAKMIKAMVVNSFLGRIGFDLRDTLDLYKAAWKQLEALPNLSNDILARQLVERLCEDGKIFIDVGCHIGSVVAGVSRHSSPSRILAVEAIPEKVVALRKRFPNVDIHECAVSDSEGKVEFVIDLARSGYSSLDPAVKNRSASTRIIQVKVTTLDVIMPNEGVDLVKIDVEGAELGVLRGSRALVAASRPIFMFESGPEEMSGFPKADLWQWFADHDYDVLLPNRVAHFGPGMSLDNFLDSHLYPRYATNYFGVPRERRDTVRLRARKILDLDKH